MHIAVVLIGIYDGDCGICSAFAAFASSRKPLRPLALKPAHDFSETELARYGLTYADCLEAFQLVDDETTTRLLQGGPAVRAVLAATGGALGQLSQALGYLSPLLLLEPPVYRFIARNRTAISAMLGLRACRIPTGTGRSNQPLS